MSIGRSEIVLILPFRLGLGMRVASYPGHMGGEKRPCGLGMRLGMRLGSALFGFSHYLMLNIAKLDYIALID